VTDVEAQFEAGQFQAVVTHLQGRARTARESTLYGVALMRVGRLEDAEVALTHAACQGEPEGQVEYGNLLRLLGRFAEAVTQFERIWDGLAGELQLRALRWWGVAQFQAGDAADGLRRVERAWHGYLALGDDELSARVTLSLAQMYRKSGNDRRAKALLTEAVHALPPEPDPAPRVGALRQLLELHLSGGEFAEAREALAEARRSLEGADAPRLHALLLTSEAELLRLTGEAPRYASVLETLRPLADALGDRDLRLWTVSRLAEHYSLHGQHGKAVDVLLGYGLMPSEWPAELWATSGVVERRRGDLVAAQASLGVAAQMLRAAGRVPELCRVQLHYAATCLRLGGEHAGQATQALGEAVTQLLRLRLLSEFKPDFEELSELMHYALLQPETAPLMEPLLDHLAQLAGSPQLPVDGGVTTLSVKTLGQMAVFREGVELPFVRRGCVPLLVYLTLNPGRTRAEIQLDLWPDKDPTTAGAYVRQCLKELRDRLGHDLIHSQGPHHAPWYRLGKLVHLELDLTQFLEAVERQELAWALALYRGAFLPDAEPCDWIETKRESLLLTLAYELRAQMARAQSEGDYRRVVLLANQYLRADPHDREVMEERVAAARLVASPHELARYTAELNRYAYH